MALAHEQKGQLGKAIPAMEKCYELDKQPEALAQLGHMYAAAGRIADAERVLGTLQRVAETRYVSAYSMGLVYAGLRRADRPSSGSNVSSRTARSGSPLLPSTRAWSGCIPTHASRDWCGRSGWIPAVTAFGPSPSDGDDQFTVSVHVVSRPTPATWIRIVCVPFDSGGSIR